MESPCAPDETAIHAPRFLVRRECHLGSWQVAGPGPMPDHRLWYWLTFARSGPVCLVRRMLPYQDQRFRIGQPKRAAFHSDEKRS